MSKGRPAGEGTKEAREFVLSGQFSHVISECLISESAKVRLEKAVYFGLGITPKKILENVSENKEENKTYSIIRFYKDNRDKEIIQEGLTKEQAKEHCSSEESKGDDWFDGFKEE